MSFGSAALYEVREIAEKLRSYYLILRRSLHAVKSIRHQSVHHTIMSSLGWQSLEPVPRQLLVELDFPSPSLGSTAAFPAAGPMT